MLIFFTRLKQSDKRYSFYLPAADPGSSYVAVAESPIDDLSCASLLRMQGEDWTGNHYLSLGGTAPWAPLGFLRDHPAVTHVSLCLDNDAAGLAGVAVIREAVEADKELSPPRKRYNKHVGIKWTYSFEEGAARCPHWKIRFL